MTFEEAQEAVTKLPAPPANDVLLKLYSLFKQGTVGDVSGSRPGMMDMKGRAKFDAWAKIKGQSNDEAKANYISLVEELVAG